MLLLPHRRHSCRRFSTVVEVVHSKMNAHASFPVANDTC